MKIHEYQAKEILRHYGIPTPRGRVAGSGEEAAAVAAELRPPVAVKAQIHAGGRGKAGGVRLAAGPGEAAAAARALLGTTLVTPQTGPAGRLVRKVLLEEGAPVDREMYVGLSVNRQDATIVILTAGQGGMEIEELAAREPERLGRVAVNPLVGLRSYHRTAALAPLGLDPEDRRRAGDLLARLYRLFTELDCSLAEINPLVLTRDGELLALDAKMVFDDNGLFRHPEIAELRDPGESSALEAEAAGAGLNYISLDGTIGSMVNGAGLAMATMDLIAQVGGRAANFLDVGGGASADQVARGLAIILADPRVKGVFINIFGGILRCDVLAQGVVAAAADHGLQLPVVVRLEGTNVEEGRRILAASGLPVRVATTLAQAAEELARMVAEVEGRS